MADSQVKKRKRTSLAVYTASKNDTSKRPKRCHQVPRAQDCSNLRRRPRRKPINAQLPRPKRPVMFSLPEYLISSLSPADNAVSPSATPSSKAVKPRNSALTTSSTVDTPYIRLLKTQLILNRVHHRNKNQHRKQPFYKHLNILRRTLSRLIELYKPASPVAPAKSTSTIKSTPASTKPAQLSAEQTRISFEHQAKLRSRREELETWLRENLIPACYVGFSSLIADSQFANLGVVLMACLADVVGVVGVMRTVQKMPTSSNDKKVRGEDNNAGVAAVEGWSTAVTGPDVGVVVRRVYEGSEREVQAEEQVGQQDEGVVVERQRQQHVSGEADMEATSRTETPTTTTTTPTIPAPKPKQPRIIGAVAPHAHVSGTTTVPSKTDHGHHPVSEKSKRNPKTSSEDAATIHTDPEPETRPTPSSHHGTPHGSKPIPPHKANKTSKPQRQNQVAADTNTPAKSGKPQSSIPDTNTKPKDVENRDGQNDKKKKKKKKGNAIDDLFSGF